MDTELKARLDAQEQKIDAILASVEKTRRSFQITLWITILTIVLPILGLVVAIPVVLNSFLATI